MLMIHQVLYHITCDLIQNMINVFGLSFVSSLSDESNLQLPIPFPKIFQKMMTGHLTTYLAR